MQLEHDVQAGRLNAIGDKALRDHAAEDDAPLTHHASPDFWACYRALPAAVHLLSDQAFEHLKQADVGEVSLDISSRE